MCDLVCKHDRWFIENGQEFRKRFLDCYEYWEGSCLMPEKPNPSEYCLTHGIYNQCEKIIIMSIEQYLDKSCDVISGWCTAYKDRDGEWKYYDKIGWDTFDSDRVCKLHMYRLDSV